MSNGSTSIDKWLVRLFLFVSVMVTSVGSAAANQYWVDTNNGLASDTNPGTQSLPWKTIQKAANTMVAGDTTTVMAGTYNQRVTQTVSGSSGNRIRFIASGTVDVSKGFNITGNYVSVNGFRTQNMAATAAAGCTNPCTDFANFAPVYINGDHDIVDTCTLSSDGLTGVTLGTSADNATVQNCVIDHVGLAGINSCGNGHLFYNNEIKRVLFNPSNWNAPSWTDADGIVFNDGQGGCSSDSVTVRGNNIHDITLQDSGNTCSPSCTDIPHIDCIENDWQAGTATNITIEKNRCHDLTDSLRATQGIFFNNGNTGLMIRNNLLYNMGRGINFYGGSAVTAKVMNNTFYNITVDHAVDAGYAGTVAIIQNNIFRTIATDEVTISGCTCTVDHNTLSGTDPSFVNPTGNPPDFHITTNSVAKDGGANLSPDVIDDFEGIFDSRPQGSAYDIGAYEFH